jgi:hypothetical protein
VAAIQADLADPAAPLAHPVITRLIRPGEPTGPVLAMVLHFFEAPGCGAPLIEALMNWPAAPAGKQKPPLVRANEDFAWTNGGTTR